MLEIRITDPFNLSDKERGLLRMVLGESQPADECVESHGCHGGEGATLKVYVGDGTDIHSLGTHVVPGKNASESEIPPKGCYPDAVVVSAMSKDTAPNDIYDSEGLPWDVRIHASSHKRIGDGTWRLKREIDPAYVATVKAELRKMIADHTTLGAPLPLNAITETPPAPPAPPADTPPAPPVQTLPQGVRAPSEAFTAFMSQVTPLVDSGKITMDRMRKILREHNIEHVGVFLQIPETQRHIPDVLAAIKKEAGV
jgi:hypothetical protein